MSGSSGRDLGVLWSYAAAVVALEGIQDGKDVGEIDQPIGVATALGAGDVDVHRLASIRESPFKTVEDREDVKDVHTVVRAAGTTSPASIEVGIEKFFRFFPGFSVKAGHPLTLTPCGVIPLRLQWRTPCRCRS